jgi:hypothetical protein
VLLLFVVVRGRGEGLLGGCGWSAEVLVAVLGGAFAGVLRGVFRPVRRPTSWTHWLASAAGPGACRRSCARPSVEGEPAGCVQQPVAQPLGAGFGELAVE